MTALPETPVQGRPTEIRTLLTGGVGGLLTFLNTGGNHKWVALIPVLTGAAAYGWTWTVTHGGIIGIGRALLRGNPQP